MSGIRFALNHCVWPVVGQPELRSIYPIAQIILVKDLNRFHVHLIPLGYIQ